MSCNLHFGVLFLGHTGSLGAYHPLHVFPEAQAFGKPFLKGTCKWTLLLIFFILFTCLFFASFLHTDFLVETEHTLFKLLCPLTSE
jgi:hypothetical protein